MASLSLIELAEKAKQDEKEAKKLQDNVRALQLRLAFIEYVCKNLQEKVRDLETQLAEERKTRLKQENRALASVATQSTLTSNQAQKASTVDNKKPPLAPSKVRLPLPLRRITNFMPPAPSRALPNKKSMPMSYLPAVREDKENASRENKGKQVLKARRCTIADQVIQPKRGASIATFWSESNSSTATPPKNPSSRMMRTDRVMGQQPFDWVPGSWKPKHPTVVALQKKVVWSPLKLRGMKNKRNSYMS